MVLLWYCFDIWGWFGAGLGHVIFYICRRFGEGLAKVDNVTCHVTMSNWQRYGNVTPP